MKSLNKKTAVVLFNLGGPDKLESVEPFLFNLFNDKAIISLPQPFRFFLAKLISKRRTPKAQKIYQKIGGKSPLLEITESQAHALEVELSFIGNFKVFVAMRYFNPFASEVIKKVKDYDPSHIILLPLYPQFSSATSDSSLKEFVEKLSAEAKNFNQNISLKTVCCYPSEPDFIKSHALLIKQTILKFYDGNLDKFRFLFSAHGLPQKLIDAGDPYVFQVTETTNQIVKNFAENIENSEGKSAAEIIKKIDFKICYQSKVGPLKWTSPSLEHEIRKVVLDKKIPVIIPVAFVSDHSETLVELDIDYKEMAEKLGAKNYLRVPALNIDGHFIKALLEICKEVSNNSDSIIFSGTKAHRICPKKFKLCPNFNDCKA
jgi:protoporphyrin/coproporphyrin ferrochelatase